MTLRLPKHLDLSPDQGHHNPALDLAAERDPSRRGALDRRAPRARQLAQLVLACGSVLALSGPARASTGAPAADAAAPPPSTGTAAPRMPEQPAPAPMPEQPASAPMPEQPAPAPAPTDTDQSLPPLTTPVEASAELPGQAPAPAANKSPRGTGLVIVGAVLMAPTVGLLVFGGLGKLWNANCDLICGDGSLSTGLLIGGGALGVAGISMLVTGVVMRNNDRAQVAVAPIGGHRMTGLALTGHF